jgi:hypothetical protein
MEEKSERLIMASDCFATPALDEAIRKEIQSIDLEDFDRIIDEALDAELDTYLEELGPQVTGVTLNGGPIFKNDF